MVYEIKLADGDRIFYNSDLGFEDLKKFVSENPYIDIPRNGWERYGNNGWKTVPKLASYQTKAIVYIDHRPDIEEAREKEAMRRDIINPMVNKILKYTSNKRMNAWLFFNLPDKIECVDDWYGFSSEFLQTVLYRFEKYNCNIKEE